MPRRFLIRVIRVVVICAALLPATSFGAWRLFLVWFRPPAPDVPASITTEAVLLTDSEWPGTRIRLQTPRGEQGIDDAGCRCRAEAMELVELRVETDNVNFIGHAFIATRRVSVGFRTADMDFGPFDYLWPFSSTVPGFVGDDHDHAFDRVRQWRACPETVTRLEASLAARATDPYQVGNWRGGRNCATWARDRLREAGLIAPPGDCPNKMAWAMWPRNESECASNPCRTVSIGVSMK